MRCPRTSSVLLAFLGSAAFGTGVAVGCGTDAGDSLFSNGGGGASTTTSGTGGAGGGTGGGTGGAGGSGTGTGGSGGTGNGGGTGGVDEPGDGGPADAQPDVPMTSCGTECGPLELCETDRLGLDDNCNGLVDEGCPCIAGQAHSCFKGDPSYRAAGGCFPGTERCDEAGEWSDCIGGVHATELCYASGSAGCHPLQAAPFADVNLKDGTGTFSADAVAGTEQWTVTCPTGVDPCPGVGGIRPDDFKPLQSGEYTVLYSKRLANGTTQTCQYPLFVGAPGLRVELEWEHDRGSVDLDLHVHKPNDTQPWSMTGSDVDCGWNNCTIRQLSSTSRLNWFSDTAVPPDPVNWYLDPVESNNTCYFLPRGAGEQWRNNGRGCHNPRLDIDNITCDPSVTDPKNNSFCAPENINLDYPPNGEWMRVAVHYFGNMSAMGNLHPRVKIFCNGALGGELGPGGFYDPGRPVAFAPSDSATRAWLVADVAFSEATECNTATCVVQPLYQDAMTKTPLLTTRSFIETNFGPPYPPAP